MPAATVLSENRCSEKVRVDFIALLSPSMVGVDVPGESPGYTLCWHASSQDQKGFPQAVVSAITTRLGKYPFNSNNCAI
jgi:hypothetical protein